MNQLRSLAGLRVPDLVSVSVDNNHDIEPTALPDHKSYP